MRAAAMPPPRFLSHGLTHVGLVRRRNEDAFIERSEQGPGVGLWAVADGMGGHDEGDYASARIVAVLGELKPQGELGEVAEAAAAQLREVDAELRARAARLGPSATIASTVVVLLADASEFAVLWVGDSRVYRWRNYNFQQLTVDHSRVQELVDAGLLPAEAAVRHPQSHIVTRAIGGGRLDFSIRREALIPGDRFLLCSDGLTNMLSDAEIAGEVATAPPRIAAERLRDYVLARGAVDNFTIVIVAVEV
jgi:serine/threonine protein phosphatase PrpC